MSTVNGAFEVAEGAGAVKQVACAVNRVADAEDGLDEAFGTTGIVFAAKVHKWAGAAETGVPFGMTEGTECGPEVAGD